MPKPGKVINSPASVVLHNSYGVVITSSMPYIVSIGVTGNGYPLIVARSLTESAQVNGTGLAGERTPLAVHPKKNSSFLDFA